MPSQSVSVKGIPLILNAQKYLKMGLASQPHSQEGAFNLSHRHQPGLFLLFFSLSYPQALLETQKVYHFSTLFPLPPGEKLWAWRQDTWPEANGKNALPLRSLA